MAVHNVRVFTVWRRIQCTALKHSDETFLKALDFLGPRVGAAAKSCVHTYRLITMSIEPPRKLRITVYDFPFPEIVF